MTPPICHPLQSRSKHPRRARPPRLHSLAVALALMLCFTPSHAGPLEDAVDRIENKLDATRSKVNDIKSDTNILGNATSIAGQIQPQTFDDIRSALADAQALLNLVKSQATGALNNRANHPDLAALVSGVESAIKALMGDAGNNVNLTVLSQLLGVLPDKALAVIGQGLLTAGIDRNFTTRLNSTASGLVGVLAVVNEEVSEVPRKFMRSGTGCALVDYSRGVVKFEARNLLIVGSTAKLAGKVLSGLSKTVAVGKKIEPGIHGYASFTIETDGLDTVGKITEGLGTALVGLATAAGVKLRHCETLFYQQTQLNEMCELTRFRSPACQRWLNSVDRVELLPLLN